MRIVGTHSSTVCSFISADVVVSIRLTVTWFLLKAPLCQIKSNKYIQECFRQQSLAALSEARVSFPAWRHGVPADVRRSAVWAAGATIRLLIVADYFTPRRLIFNVDFDVCVSCWRLVCSDLFTGSRRRCPGWNARQSDGNRKWELDSGSPEPDDLIEGWGCGWVRGDGVIWRKAGGGGGVWRGRSPPNCICQNNKTFFSSSEFLLCFCFLGKLQPRRLRARGFFTSPPPFDFFSF